VSVNSKIFSINLLNNVYLDLFLLFYYLDSNLANLEIALNHNNPNLYLINQNTVSQQAGFMSPSTLRVNLTEQQRINQISSAGGNEIETNGYQMMFMNVFDPNINASQTHSQTSSSGVFQSINTSSDLKQPSNSFNSHETQANNEQANHDLSENKDNRIYESSSMEELDNNKSEQEPMLSSHYASNILSVKQKQQQQQQNFQKYNIKIGENNEEERQLI
jgi:hypothetical protein